LKRVAVIKFPGASAADDVAHVYRNVLGYEVDVVWHLEETVGSPDLLILPGGASFADYLRPGALALPSPVISGVRKFARAGGYILGLGNGFQILCETGLLPGVLLQNTNTRFLNETVTMVATDSKMSHPAEGPFGWQFKENDTIALPIACNYGRYYADRRVLKDIEENGQVIFRYGDEEGEIDYEKPYNGCSNAIAAVANKDFRIIGMMCRPERVCEEIFGSKEGLRILL
jgi:phosphoribosylformylglycinamidine synthase